MDFEMSSMEKMATGWLAADMVFMMLWYGEKKVLNSCVHSEKEKNDNSPLCHPTPLLFAKKGT